MKSVLISIQPKWCELIASGKKTVEVRKTKPKLYTPFKCYIYCTNTKPFLAWGDVYRGGSWETEFSALRGYNREEAERFFELFNGKVIGEFVCDCIANFEPDDFAEYGEYEYKTIADNGDDFWRENMLCESSCLTIEELRKYVGTGIATIYGWHISDLVIYDEPKELSEFCRYDNTYDNSFGYAFEDRSKYVPLSRPPQSWCYVDHPTEKGGGKG